MFIYLDNAATTKPDGECLEKARRYLTEDFFNPSSMYKEGYIIKTDLNSAKDEILSHICLSTEEWEMIFTSCGTEADNQAVFCGAKRGNIVTTMGEHSAVYQAVSELSQRGFDVRYAGLNPDGSVNVENLLSLVDDGTSFVSCIHVNNETGAINDIDNISALVKKKSPRVMFHSDGVQAFGKIAYKLGMNVDMYSVSAHKIGALKGTGALIKRKKIVIKPYIYGGGQEKGLRSGTENVFGIKMMQFAAMKRYSKIEENYKRVSDIKYSFISALDNGLFKIISSDKCSPYIVCMSVPGVRGETIMHEASDRGLLIGTGSACSSNDKKRYSRVILACGISEKEADGILRVSFCPENTVDEAVASANILNEVVKNRKASMEM